MHLPENGTIGFDLAAILEHLEPLRTTPRPKSAWQHVYMAAAQEDVPKW